MIQLDNRPGRGTLCKKKLLPGGLVVGLRRGYESFAPRLTCLRASGGVLFGGASMPVEPTSKRISGFSAGQM
jgi:hypothetical protein